MMSLNDITTEFCVLIECVSLILYSNGIMQYRESRAKSNLIIILGYIVIGALCLLYIPVLNIISFIVITFIVLYMGFAETTGRIVLNVIILTVFMMFTELIAEFIISVNIFACFQNTVFCFCHYFKAFFIKQKIFRKGCGSAFAVAAADMHLRLFIRV